MSDLIYLQIISGLLQQEGREALSDKITIVPVGGMEKVATFVSLLRGSNLGIACLLDSSIDSASKSKLDNMIKEKIIHQKNILFFDQFVDADEADIEDLFSKEDYLKMFNPAFSEHKDIAVSDLKSEITRMVLQINHLLGVERYNHYRPANFLARQGVDAKTFSKETLDRFEAAFREVNKIFAGEAIKKAA